MQPEPCIRKVFGSRLPPLTDGQLDDQGVARPERQRLLTGRTNTEFGFIIEPNPMNATDLTWFKSSVDVSAPS
ncbi:MULTISPECIES: hypothetical protein [Streptomyces]|uniref:Uncharacterized protein n=2 Tax=Streptomyces TaxID=1883 RepID=A0A3R7ISJ4_9ACTN|nr:MULTISPECIES: hypothetical protein [Streptomyces]KNE84215.1 hypothetical protein ADZ36_00380 [Streptomyces fradiae]OFA58556.1 hypothetical protein BEN35_03755 [Streptomyces fradiae]PQM22064.1 hypothetical protein Sfr7A_17530 [Streptomyces xinghaiensis]RKM95315.1 hypothetical protein SFRA_014655 [Streptomyces xinghaiensis]RNC72899.1 hypothetical protein DC095_017080 [Streptomyces xinghaiensis]